jgi:hypothetical protein
MAKRAIRDFDYEFGDFVDNQEVPHISIGQNIQEPVIVEQAEVLEEEESNQEFYDLEEVDLPPLYFQEVLQNRK